MSLQWVHYFFFSKVDNLLVIALDIDKPDKLPLGNSHLPLPVNILRPFFVLAWGARAPSPPLATPCQTVRASVYGGGSAEAGFELQRPPPSGPYTEPPLVRIFVDSARFAQTPPSKSPISVAAPAQQRSQVISRSEHPRARSPGCTFFFLKKVDDLFLVVALETQGPPTPLRFFHCRNKTNKPVSGQW